MRMRHSCVGVDRGRKSLCVVAVGECWAGYCSSYRCFYVDVSCGGKSLCVEMAGEGLPGLCLGWLLLCLG